MLLNEIKILQELDREGFVAGALGRVGVNLRIDGADKDAKDVDPKLFPLLQQFITKMHGTSPTVTELHGLFGNDKESIQKLKSAIGNVKSVLNKMSNTFAVHLRKPEFLPVAKASTIKPSIADQTAWINVTNTEALKLPAKNPWKNGLDTATDGINSALVFEAVKKVSTATQFADKYGTTLSNKLSAVPPATPAGVAVNAEVFLILLNIMKNNCNDIIDRL